MRKSIFIVLILLGFIPQLADGQNSIYNRGQFLYGPPSAFNNGLAGFINPANLGLMSEWEGRLYWSSNGDDFGTFDNWGFFTGKGIGFGVQHQNFGDLALTDYKLGLGFGDDGGAIGISYGWSKGDDEILGRENILTLSAIDRPADFLSIGMSGRLSTESKWNELIGEAGIRPLGNSLFTLFADASWEYGKPFEDIRWSAGGAFEILTGIELFGRYFEDETITAGINISFGTRDIGAQGHFDKEQELAYYTHNIRWGAMKPSIFPEMFDNDKRYVPLNLKGRLVYNKYLLLDGGRYRFFDLLQKIRAAGEDPRVEVIALNLSGMTAASEHIWEIREELLKARQKGIKVFAFFERAGMRLYHLASVADFVAIDPQGAVALPGYILNRSYYNRALDKLGIGVEEWRLFKYKSYMENYSRNGMSDADYLQRKAFVDDWYESVRDDICESRNMTYQEYDYLIDSVTFFLPEQARKHGLVDTLARWHEVGEIIKRQTGKKHRALSADDTYPRAIESQNWGEKDQIAIVYALGPSAMDYGIKGRWLRKVFKRLSQDDRVKGVVFRIDSPGGDGMAADIVAEALRECAKRKPVVVSQGIVAASAGYWLSACGDSILAGPFTSTGSIGVIAGWIYDDGLGEKTGISHDFAKRGEHADLSHGISLPFTSLRLPGRNLTEYERNEADKRLMAIYENFTAEVAEARGLSLDSVVVISEGRTWSGLAAVENGLVDRIGGLTDAVEMVRKMTNSDPDKEIEYLEIPDSHGLVNFSRLFKSRLLPSFDLWNDPLYQYLKFRSEQVWQPLMMLPPGSYPDEDYIFEETGKE